MGSPAVDALEFAVETALSPGEIRAAGKQAATAGRFDGAIRENLVTAGSVSYAVVHPESLATLMTMVVSWHELGAERRRVTLIVRGHVVVRGRLLGVPVGRASVPALEPAAQFASTLRGLLGESRMPGSSSNR
ncbi:protein of unknown function [Modestobacter italicus]|uniref:Uncharacterized protein n=1 Tax=Modestobacter italicus (strain DSM 44449 / CECT 9708 / BC 501) TaxID=2732864 RepID=I4ER84_MODI5|nr:hypothetical protein [Modestobacter marinus]CCH85897.1 protein of unknown function [Modestobacter marinus]